MVPELWFDPRSQETRELLAQHAYERVIGERAARLREHDLGDENLYCLSWETIDDAEKHSYRAAVAVCMDAVIQVFES